MKFIFVRRSWCETGGAEQYLRRLASMLHSDGHQTVLWCEEWRGQDPAFHQVERLPVRGRGAARLVHFVNEVNRRRLGDREGLLFSMERGVKSDVYRAGEGVHAVWLRRRVRGRPWWGRVQNLVKPKNRILCDLERITFHPDNTRLVIANSEMVREDILRCFDFPSERIHLIPNGVEVEKFASGDRQAGRHFFNLSERDFLVLLVGAGAERKGHQQAREVVRDFPSWVQLRIIDRPPGIPMPDVYAAADAFLFPTLYDPFANVTLEAMAAGLPVITTRDNGASMVIEHGQDGFVVEHAFEIWQMRAYLTTLFERSVREKIRAAARLKAAQWTLRRNVDATVGLCRRLLSL